MTSKKKKNFGKRADEIFGLDKKVFLVLFVIFLAGFFIRVYPAAVNDRPLGHDTSYHARVAELVKEKGTITEEPWLEGGRPYIYPPGYHILLASLSVLSGLPVLTVIRFVLPLFSALLILSVFFIVRKFRNSKTALLSAFLIAASPFLLSAYDSPEIIALFLVSLSLFFFLREKYLHTGIFLGISVLFSAFTVFLAFPLALLLAWERKFGKIAELSVLPVLLAAAWYIPRASAVSCFEGFIGPFFTAKDVIGFWTQYFIPVVLGCVLISFALLNKLKDRFSKFWAIWVVFFTALYLTYFISPSLYPWRMPPFIAFGFAFLLPDALLTAANKFKSYFEVFFISLFVFSTFAVFSTNVMRTSLDDNEYSLINWSKSLNGTTLANPVLCANFQTLTGKKCLLDLNFECIPNKQSWFEYQNFFYSEPSASFFKKYDIDYIFMASNNQKRAMLEENADKIYSSWTDSFDSAIYKVVK